MTEAAHPTLALLELARDVELEVAGLLEPHGLTLRKLRILRLTADVPGISAPGLARRLRSTSDDLRMLVRALVDAGLLRSNAGGSGHEPLIAVTAHGSELLARLDAGIDLLDARMFASEELQEVARAVVAATAAPDRAPQD